MSTRDILVFSVLRAIPLSAIYALSVGVRQEGTAQLSVGNILHAAGRNTREILSPMLRRGDVVWLKNQSRLIYHGVEKSGRVGRMCSKKLGFRGAGGSTLHYGELIAPS